MTRAWIASFGDDYDNITDDIMYLTYTLDAPITLPAGEYWFSHDAEIVPEPASVVVWSLLGMGLAAVCVWRRKRAV